MKILVTGGAGFIGSHLVERLLDENHDVIVMDDFNDYYDPVIKRQNLNRMLQNIELVEADIRDSVAVERVFARSNLDMVVHLAARAGVRPSITNPKLYFTTNIDGTFNLLDACRYHGVDQFVFASSSSVYGVNKKVPFSETDPIERTISPYAATKLACEQICSNYSHLFGLRITCLRFFTVYGPRQRPDLAISKFVHAIKNNIPLQKYGDGTSERDYTYIDDIVDGISSAMDYDASDFSIFNLGGSVRTSLNDLISLIEQEVGKRALIETHPVQEGDVPRTYADVSKAEKCLGFRSRVHLKKGIANYVKWYDCQEKVKV